MKQEMCKKQDIDVPNLICGYPLPCPYHTVNIDLSVKPVPTITYPVTVVNDISPKDYKEIKEIAKIINELGE